MKKFGLPKECLLRKPGEFEQVYRRGKRVKGNGFTIIFLPNGQQDNRLGISVHRKVRGAVRRNRIKRIVRESFRLRRDIFPGASDVVFAVRPEFGCQTVAAIWTEMAHLALVTEYAG